MISPKDKAKAPKDSMTLLPCFYFVEVGVGKGDPGGVMSSPPCDATRCAWGSATTHVPMSAPNGTWGGCGWH